MYEVCHDVCFRSAAQGFKVNDVHVLDILHVHLFNVKEKCLKSRCSFINTQRLARSPLIFILVFNADGSSAGCI